MKRLISIFVILSIILSCMLVGLVPTAAQENYLQYTAIDMYLIGDGTGWQRFGVTENSPVSFMATDKDFIADAGYAFIREFKVPESGVLKIDTEWTTGITMGMDASHDNYPINYAITDKSGKIVFPTSGELGSVTYSNPVTISQSEPLIFDVNKGDVYSFILIDNYGLQIPTSFMARVFVNDVQYDSSGYLRGLNYNAQGEGGWSYKYATSVTVSQNISFNELENRIAEAEAITDTELEQYTLKSVEEFKVALANAKELTSSSPAGDITAAATALNNAISGLEEYKLQQYLSYTANEMELIDSASWVRWGNKATGYTIITTPGEDYIQKAEAATIRQLTVPQSGTLQIDTEWTTGIVVGNEWTTSAAIKYAITDKNGKILFPKNGQMGTATYGIPVTISINDPVLIEVEAGDTINFVAIDEQGSGAPIHFCMRVTMGNTTYGTNGYLRGANCNAQGEEGWRYLYANSVTVETKSDLSKLLPVITQAETVLSGDTSNYTEDSLDKLEETLTAAKALTESSTQYSIDKTEKELKDAISGLETKPMPEKSDLTKLSTVISEAEQIISGGTSKYTEASVTKLNSVLATAKALTENSLQSDIDKAEKELKAAIDELELKEKLPQFLEFDVKEMVLLDNGETWLRWGNQDKDYTIITTPGEDYIQKAGAATIREFTVSQSGTLQIDTEWTGGLTVGNQYTPNATAKYAIADKNGKVIFPKNEQVGTVRNGTPVTISINDPVLVDVEAGDKIYFVVVDEQGSGAPILFNVRVTMGNTTYGTNGCLRGPECNVQGEEGWRYLYADSVTVTAKSDLTGITSLIEKAEKILKNGTYDYTAASVTALNSALAEAKTLTNTSLQTTIDKIEDALRDAIMGLKIKPTDKSVKRLGFTPKKMTFDEEALLWKAEGNSSCTLSAPYSVSSKLSDGYVSIRKMVAPRAGSLQIDFGEGVYIDNASGRFNDTSVEFAIADKFGRIVYPQNGGTLTLESDKKYPIKLSLDNVAVGDSFYFMVFKASADNIPVVMHMGVSISNVAINNEAGFLYGLDGAQGAFSWFYMYANDLTFLTDAGNIPEVDNNKGDDSNDKNENQDANTDNRLDKDYTESPETSDASDIFKIVCIFVSSLTAFVVFAEVKFKKIKSHMG